MAKVFLDANAFIDLVEDRSRSDIEDIAGNLLYISTLSIHILCYLYKYHVPERKLVDVNKIYTLIPFDEAIAINSLIGPTLDFEDNVQLHSAAEADCNIFLTSDEGLLDLKFFGKMQILSKLISIQS